MFYYISTPLGGGSSVPTGLSSGWARAAQGSTFKTLLSRSFVPRPIEYRCQVSSTSAQRSRSLRVLKKIVNTTRMDGRTHARTFDQFYKSSAVECGTFPPDILRTISLSISDILRLLEQQFKN